MENLEDKTIGDFSVIKNIALSESYSLLMLSPDSGQDLARIKPGQFVQIKTPSKATFLRRPISVCFIDDNNLLWLLVRSTGDGTTAINNTTVGDKLNLILPLGNGFSIDIPESSSPLLIGGGIGVAPLLYLGERLFQKRINVKFLLGARSADDILLLNEFKKYGNVYISTEDGSLGEKGLITHNSILNEYIDHIFCCGPMPMMKAVAAIARAKNINCEVSLENLMGCGIGACLCCVEKTIKGNLCVCSEGPVFNINELLWHD